MDNITFLSVTEENQGEFHRLMLMYSRELDEHQDRSTDSEILNKWTDSMIAKQHDSGRCLKLCCAGGGVIGFLFGKIDSEQDKGFKKPGYGYVMEFYVLPEYRNSGYGRKMFRHLEGFFRSNGVKRMYLTADPVTGKPFWEALGFVSTGERSPENKLNIYEKRVSAEEIDVSVSEFLTPELVVQIAQAQWEGPDWAYSITRLLLTNKIQTDCFNVIAKNESGGVIGRLFCIKNDSDSRLWYYGDLFVIPGYRRRHIAERMLELAERTLCGKWCAVLRCYVEPENTPSLDLQRKLGFEEKPYLPFNNLINEGRLMFEKRLPSFSAAAINPDNAGEYGRYVAWFYNDNIEALHGGEITLGEWRDLLSAGDTDEMHFLIRKGAMPCAYLKINGLDGDSAGWISVLAVEPAFQRRGIGEYAVRFAEDYLRSRGFTAVSLHTTKDNIPAQRLYSKCGYAVSEEIEYVTGDGVKREGYTFTKII